MFPTNRSVAFRLIALIPIVVVLTLNLAAQTATDATGSNEKVLIRSSKPYDDVVSRIEATGGKVSHSYKYVDAIAAEIPRDSLDEIRSLVGPSMITKDVTIPAPMSVNTIRDGELSVHVDPAEAVAESAEGIAEADLAALASVQPETYLMNNFVMNVAPLHAGNFLGQDVIVAVIDSGIRPGFPHLTLDGSVIGGEDFVGDGRGFSHALNGGHGTFVAGMISANANFTFGQTALLLKAARLYCPECITGPANATIPMVGTAPLSSIYALRVFGSGGSDAGAPTSRILKAVERVIELREKFDAGQPGGVNIQVCNMSLGGPTVFAGRDLFDRSVNVMVERGIVLTIAAGNAGPSSLTGGSPGSSFEALTVGAASQAHNERILRDLQGGLGLGARYRPFDGTQTADFSSRGPTADGRIDPDVTANGFASYGQGLGSNGNAISITSGTSFSAPSVAGVAALLRQAFPSATARQIRNAIILSANPDVLDDGSTELDQGAGFVDADAAKSLLARGDVPDTSAKPHKLKKTVAQNVEQNTSLVVWRDDVLQRVEGLWPGQRADFLYEVKRNASQVTVSLAGFAAELPPERQNQLFFGDDIFLRVHSAQTSSVAEYVVKAFTKGGTFVISDPEPGLLRVTVMGDTTNAGNVAVDVAINSTISPPPPHTFKGKITEGETQEFVFMIPADTSRAVFSLSWKGDWSKYPTSDIDMILKNPAAVLNFAGATINSPETVVIDRPLAGTWTIFVKGFEIPAGTDSFEVRVILDAP
jgi:subtilisin family serine protease